MTLGDLGSLVIGCFLVFLIMTVLSVELCVHYQHTSLMSYSETRVLKLTRFPSLPI
jgi:hypothetical protein